MLWPFLQLCSEWILLHLDMFLARCSRRRSRVEREKRWEPNPVDFANPILSLLASSWIKTSTSQASIEHLTTRILLDSIQPILIYHLNLNNKRNILAWKPS